MGKDNRMQKLIETGQKVFRSGDLARIWGITSRQNLHTTLSRYTQNNSPLYSIQKGLYSVIDPEKIEKNYLISISLPFYNYVSTESVLAQAGIITQEIPYLTLVGQRSLTGEILNNHYKVRQLKNDYLFNDLGIQLTENYLRASVERAVADLLYFNPLYYLDNKGAVNWEQVDNLLAEIYSIKR